MPHQANQRIIEAACSRLGIPAERAVANIDRWGNTSGASIAIALAEAAEAGRISRATIVLLVRLRRRHDLGLGASCAGPDHPTTTVRPHQPQETNHGP